ncbi:MULTISPECIES: glycoside hydrolase family 13 protein [Leeuwenhoekiella]|jgi:oligo-1,6-glucosidase|uniref:Oligo-1,6-glucosidase n=2 Tax=Leeuwenhoekiella TaxID=283735 RepID=A3XGN3_LEEBM|nr:MULTISPECIES: alpha-glucosidase [Leeuwenhoekiella]EAQ50717.1 oligo-1,6-glucosidase [Leeuwenhoekiella blandensis MED217]MAO44705.1 alpha-glucosidase [Leeuwenhoekiella sp.]MBQ52981.1 alpha-glucosidase [Leeuwenhoekiella sp.]HCW63073.1 alpha-glucosidase [Leeuwenhoekiella sp.]|tara:strand:+ start:654 stop:2402 length:1749 start_codon:yes stop_codon:yes gene_type:complete
MKKILLLSLISLTLYSCAEKKKEPIPTREEEQSIDKKWWKEAIVYQIYPRSFQDTDGDGVGDLQGIINRLDYVKDLGVTAVWLNPIYSSPNDDNGYDVSDYRNIMSDFGTMQDFDTMLSEMHARDIKLVMDIVVNHSSDEHPWFKESRSSRDNPYRDYYHWWPAEKGAPPYRYSLFDAEGNAWKYDEKTDAYYLHYFSQKQPDLNWENPKVRQEVYDIMTFWAEKGVDGFRLDAFQFAAKDTTFPEFPEGFEKNFIQYYAMQDGLHEYLKEMNEQVLSKYDVMSVAEGAGRTLEEAHELVDADRKEINMAYAFDGVDIPKVDGYKLSTFKETFSKWDSAFADKGWISIFLSNHDQARMVSRYANDSLPYRAPSAKMLNTFILTMRGTPYCYFGDELGMTNNPKLQNIEDYQDIAAINGYKKAKSQDEDMEAFMRNLRFGSRDHGRTPMQWDASENAGFTTGNPWLPLNPNYAEINTQAEEADENSVLNHFKKLTALRKNADALIYGDYELLIPEHPQVYAYTRSLGDEQFLIVLNFSQEQTSVELEGLSSFSELKINNYSNLKKTAKTLSLAPYQAVILAKS